MGTPLPPNEIGVSCPNCFGPGKIWDGDPTPKFVYMKFYGWAPGWLFEAKDEQMLLATQLLQQTSDPCEYHLTGNEVEFYFRFELTYSMALIQETIYGHGYFFGRSENPCELVIANEIIEYGGGAAFGGWAMVSWNPEDLL